LLARLKLHNNQLKFIPTYTQREALFHHFCLTQCWTYETSVILDNPITNNIPYNEFFQYYGPDFKLHLTPSDMPNLNSRDELERTKNRILQNLSSIDHAPSVQMQEIPPDMYLMPEEDQDADPDVRISQAQSDKMVERDEEFYEDDKDQDTH
jgi:hypothetical protein